MMINNKLIKWIGKLVTYPIFTPNIFSVICWVFVVCIFALPEALRYKISNDSVDNIDGFHPILFAITTILLLLWTVTNDYSAKMLKYKKCFLVLIILNWVIIPAFVISSMAYNGILSYPSGESNLPMVIVMMYSIVIIIQLINYAKLKMGVVSKYKAISNLIVLIGTPIYVILNICFWIFFVFSWIAWYRSTING